MAEERATPVLKREPLQAGSGSYTKPDSKVTGYFVMANVQNIQNDRL